MYLFDLHCDTITRLYTGERLEKDDRELRSNHAHIDLERMRHFQWCQSFAIFMPDHYRGEAAIRYFAENYAYFCTQLEKNSDIITQAKTTGEILSALGQGKSAAWLTVEGGSVLAGDLGRVCRLQECGVKMLSLTWNGANELGSGNLTENGLTDFGKAAIGELEQAGIVVDVSHLNDAGFWEAAKLAKKPMAASHSNARAVCPHLRNLTDDQIRFLAETGGLIGLNFYTAFISGREDPPFEDLAKHVAHFLELGGEDVLALGSDYDGADMPSWLEPAERMETLYEKMQQEFGAKITEKVFFQNAFSFFERYERG